MTGRKIILLGEGAWYEKHDGYYTIGNQESTTVLTENQFDRMFAFNSKKIMNPSLRKDEG